MTRQVEGHALWSIPASARVTYVEPHLLALRAVMLVNSTGISVTQTGVAPDSLRDLRCVLAFGDLLNRLLAKRWQIVRIATGH